MTRTNWSNVLFWYSALSGAFAAALFALMAGPNPIQALLATPAAGASVLACAFLFAGWRLRAARPAILRTA